MADLLSEKSRRFCARLKEQEKLSKQWTDEVYAIIKEGGQDAAKPSTIRKKGSRLIKMGVRHLCETLMLNQISGFTETSLEGVKGSQKIGNIMLTIEGGRGEVNVEGSNVRGTWRRLSEIPEVNSSRLENFFQSNNNQHRCHEGTTYLSTQLFNSFGISNDVVTGFLHYYGKKGKFRHSWVEGEYEGEQVVFDCEQNVIMSKNLYYFLAHAQAVNRISAADFTKDMSLYADKFVAAGLGVQDYFLFRNEIIGNLRKLGEDENGDALEEP